jgi:hypothetical protein
MILGILFALLLGIELLAPKPVNWMPQYNKQSQAPFGTSALFEWLPALFPEVTEQSLPLYSAFNEKILADHNLVIINDRFNPDKLDTRELLRFAEGGNNVFIAAFDFNGDLADTMKIKTSTFMSLDHLVKDTGLFKLQHTDSSAMLRFTGKGIRNSWYMFGKGYGRGKLTSYDTLKTTILVENGNREPVMVRQKWGHGAIYFCSSPEVFANYLITYNGNSEFAFTALSMLPEQTTIWDEYYKSGNKIHESELKVILSNPALRAAYMLVIFSALLLMLFGMKRKQRVIPELDPFRNTTLDFVEVVGTLYYQSGDHRNIAIKKINYFLEFLRNKFQVNTIKPDDNMFMRVSNLSGIEESTIRELFRQFEEILQTKSVTEKQLQKLNTSIEEFHANNKR